MQPPGGAVLGDQTTHRQPRARPRLHRGDRHPTGGVTGTLRLRMQASNPAAGAGRDDRRCPPAAVVLGGRAAVREGTPAWPPAGTWWPALDSDENSAAV